MLAEFRDWSLFRSGAGWCRKGDRGSMIFMQGKRRGHTNLCTHIRELCYSKEVRGEGQQKMCFTNKVEGHENFNMASPICFCPDPPLNNDRSLI